jgi:hypothetical protein
MQLFFSSTTIDVRDGMNTPFWEARWMNGIAPKEIVPSLFRPARFKNRSVHKELQNSNWIRNIQKIGSADQLEEYTILFMAISEF